MSKMLSMLLGATILLSTNVFASISKAKSKQKSEVQCLSEMMYHEARGESDSGKLAVAIVTINRAKSDKYPNNICSVIKQRGQYPWAKKGLDIKNKGVYNKISKLGEKIFKEYHLDDKLPENLKHLETAMFFNGASFKGKSFKFLTKIGNHKFYGSRKK